MFASKYRVKSTQVNRYSDNIFHAIIVFAIANSALFIGQIVEVLVTNNIFLFSSLIDLDLAILLMFVFYLQIFTSPILMGSLVIGLLLGAWYSNRVSGINSARIFLYGTMVLPIIFILTTSLIMIVFVMMMNEPLPFTLFFLMVFFIYAVVIFVIISIFGIPGYILINVLKSYSGPEKTQIYRHSQYLKLTVVPDNPVVYCPFRMKDKAGCSFLGYSIPDFPLICDYQETWLNCVIYKHLYHSLDQEFKEVNK